MRYDIVASVDDRRFARIVAARHSNVNPILGNVEIVMVIHVINVGPLSLVNI